MSRWLAAVFLLASLSSALADPETGQRAMEGLRAHWQGLARSGAVFVARCDADTFYALRLSPQTTIDIEHILNPGERYLGVLRARSGIQDNRKSRRAAGRAVPNSDPLRFECFSTPQDAKRFTETEDFQPPAPRRRTGIHIVPPDSYSLKVFYNLRDGALVLESGEDFTHSIFIRVFEPDLQEPDSPWRKVFRFPAGEK